MASRKSSAPGPGRPPAPSGAVQAGAGQTGPARAGSIQRVLALCDRDKPEAQAVQKELATWLGPRVASVVVEGDARAFCDARQERLAAGRVDQAPDLVVVLGGDGTLLSAVRAFADQPVPTLGINFGRVGFLASTPATRWRETLEGVLAGRGVVERRMRLEIGLTGENGPLRTVALNECVVQRGTHQGMLTCSLSVGEHWVTDYRADGLIVATPSGSTGYSLSAGGPILPHDVDGLVVTPISAQSLSNRPIVLSAANELVLTVAQAQGVTTLVVDGQGFYRLNQGDRVSIRRHPVPYPLYAMPGLDAYRRLRDRLGWGGVPAGTPEGGEGTPAAPSRPARDSDLSGGL